MDVAGSKPDVAGSQPDSAPFASNQTVGSSRLASFGKITYAELIADLKHSGLISFDRAFG